MNHPFNFFSVFQTPFTLVVFEKKFEATISAAYVFCYAEFWLERFHFAKLDFLLFV